MTDDVLGAAVAFHLGLPGEWGPAAVLSFGLPSAISFIQVLMQARSGS
jgi:hypothetical protein